MATATGTGKRGNRIGRYMPAEPPALKRESKSQYADGDNDNFSDDSHMSSPRPEPEKWSSSKDDKELKEKL